MTVDVDDRRRAPFCWQELDALAAIRANCPPKSLTTTIAIYAHLTEVAAERFRSGGREGFIEARKVLADGAGVSDRTLDVAVVRLEKWGLVEVEKRAEGTINLPSRYSLIPRETISPVAKPEAPSLRTSRAGEPVLLDVDNNTEGSSAKKNKFEEWLAHHVEVTGNKLMTRPGTAARRKVEQAFAARCKEYPELDLKQVSIAAYRNEYRRTHGYTSAESVLRPGAVERLLAEMTGEGLRKETSSASSIVKRLNDEADRLLAEEEREG